MLSSAVDTEHYAFHGDDKLESEAPQTAWLDGNPSAVISSGAETRRMSAGKDSWGLLALSFQTLGAFCTYFCFFTSPQLL